MNTRVSCDVSKIRNKTHPLSRFDERSRRFRRREQKQQSSYGEDGLGTSIDRVFSKPFNCSATVAVRDTVVNVV